jgi:hypothetical protein
MFHVKHFGTVSCPDRTRLMLYQSALAFDKVRQPYHAARIF